jgi:hypothetical protein
MDLYETRKMENIKSDILLLLCCCCYLNAVLFTAQLEIKFHHIESQLLRETVYRKLIL